MFDYDANSANDLLGFNVIPLALIKSGVTDLWLKIQPEKTLEKLSEEMMEVRVRTVSHMPACRCGSRPIGSYRAAAANLAAVEQIVPIVSATPFTGS